MKMRKLFPMIVSLTVLVAAVVSGVMLNNMFGFTNSLHYNDSPDLNKETGSFIKFASLYGETLDDYIDMSDAIIMGEVISDGVGFEDTWSYDISEKEQRTHTFALTSTEIRVDKILYGSVEEKIVNLVQQGSPGVTDAEAKVKKGQSVVILLKGQGNGKDYASISCENGIFYVENSKLYTLSPLEDFSKYDGCDLQVLLSDMNRIITFNNYSPENNFFKRTQKDAE